MGHGQAGSEAHQQTRGEAGLWSLRRIRTAFIGEQTQADCERGCTAWWGPAGDWRLTYRALYAHSTEWKERRCWWAAASEFVGRQRLLLDCLAPPLGRGAMSLASSSRRCSWPLFPPHMMLICLRVVAISSDLLNLPYGRLSLARQDQRMR